MKEIIRSSPKWHHQLLSRFRPRRATSQGIGENTIVGPISAKAVASAESALRWISKVPGGDKAQVRIEGALQVIKGLSAASAHDSNTLRRLEYHVRYLAELLEPFAMMHRSEISPLLQYEVLVLGRELETASLKMKPTAASDESPRGISAHKKPQEEHGSNVADIRVFAHDLKLALDQFRANALPLYTVSPIEAALHPLGVISNSSCALFPFIEWILKSERVMEHRIGSVRTVQIYHRRRQQSMPWWGQRFILIGLENRRQIENWLKIELTGPDLEGTVTFGTTQETLREGLRLGAAIHMAEDTLSVARFSPEFKDNCKRLRANHPLVFFFGYIRRTYRMDRRDPEP